MTISLRIFLLIGLVLSLGACNLWPWLKMPLQSPFPNKVIVADKAFTCPAAPAPVQDLLFESYYEDDASSIINDAAYEDYKNAVRPLNQYENQIAKFVNAGLGLCTLDWLHAWASEHALLGEVSDNGVHIRKWMLASISSAYVQTNNYEDERKQEIEAWLRVLANSVIKDYETETHKQSRQNNHILWAGWAVGITGVALKDKALFKWGIKKTK